MKCMYSIVYICNKYGQWGRGMSKNVKILWMSFVDGPKVPNVATTIAG